MILGFMRPSEDYFGEESKATIPKAGK